jgi:CheY-like chemotaxis protein
MNLLLVDDASEVHDEFHAELDGLGISIVSARSRQEALGLLDADYDLIVCDLKLPPDDSGSEPEISHGLSVSDEARAALPGTPLIILSAFGELDDLQDRLANAPRERFLGGDALAMLRHQNKRKIDEVVGVVREHADALRAIHETEIAWGTNTAVPLNRYERQSLLLYVRQRGGALVRARPLAGGRSGATVLWVEIEDAAGSIVGRGVVKIDSLVEIEDELQKYRDHVADLLPAGSYAGAVNSIRAGAGRHGLIVYSLAQPDNLFEVLREEADLAARMVDVLWEYTEPWHESLESQQRTVREIRRLLVSDEELAEIREAYGDFIDFAVEDRTALVHECRSHGDLHGGNVQATAERTPMLIDYGRVGVAPASLDPITLELSALLHPDAEVALGDWPTAEQAKQWQSESYLDGCPIRPFIEACRRWLHAVQRGDRDRDAALYAYALRQLRFHDVPPEIPIALCEGAAARLLG